MKNIAICLLQLTQTFYVHAQWSSNAGNIYYSSGSVGIGTSSPGGKFNVQSNSGVLTSITSGTSTGSLPAIRFARYSYWTSNADGTGGLNFFDIQHDYAGNKLHFEWADSPKLTLQSNGNVGIGTSSPSAKLHIAGDYTGGTGDYTNVTNSQLKLQSIAGFIRVSHISANTSISAVYNYETGKNAFWGEPSDQGVYYFRGRDMVVQQGRLGIGTSTPCSDCKLDVNGKIRGEEVKVEVVNGPDYVFEEDYNLRSLEETKVYIKQNKHLPEIPSAKEMEANGIDLGEMNMLLLKKIEELTLHLIEENRTNREQQNVIGTLRDEINHFKSRQKADRH